MKPRKDSRDSDTPMNSQSVLEQGGREGALERSSCDYSSTPGRFVGAILPLPTASTARLLFPVLIEQPRAVGFDISIYC